MNDISKMNVTAKWVRNIGTLLIGIASIILCYYFSTATNVITKTQMELTDINTKNAQQLKSMEIFLELIKSEIPREKEMAVRLLHILDKEMALELAISIATNKSEDANIALAAFRIGKQIDSAQFLEAILRTMNISLSDNNPEIVQGYLNNPDSGYQQLSEVLYRVLDRSTLDGRTVPLDNINASVMKNHDASSPILEINYFNSVFVKNAILEKWREKNSASRAHTFEEIIY